MHTYIPVQRQCLHAQMQIQTSWTSWESVVVGSFDIWENYYRCCIESARSRASTGNTSTPLCHLHCGSLLRPTNYFTVLHFRKGKCMHACADRMPEAEGGREGVHTRLALLLSLSLSPWRVEALWRWSEVASSLWLTAPLPSPLGPPGAWTQPSVGSKSRPRLLPEAPGLRRQRDMFLL